MSLADARRFLELREIRRSGINPKMLFEQERQREQNTVQKLVIDWYTNYVLRHHKRPLPIKRQIDVDIIPLLGTKELDKIQPIDITHALDSIVQRGAPVHANRVLSTIKQAFNYAVSRGSML